MDYNNLTAPCGIPCIECIVYKAKFDLKTKKNISEKLDMDFEKSECDGCRQRNGKGFLSEKNRVGGKGLIPLPSSHTTVVIKKIGKM